MHTTTHYAGLDIHATNTVIQSIDPQGVMIDGQEVPTRPETLIGWVKNYSYGLLQVLLEQGTHARWVANALAGWVDRVIICDPAENALIHGGGNKNDRVDAHKLARLLRLEEYKPVWWQPMEDRHVFKSRMKMYLCQRQAKASGIQRLIGYLRHIGVSIPTSESRFSFKRGRQWIGQIDSQEHLDLAKQKLEFIRYHHKQSRDIFKDIRRQGRQYWEIAEFANIPGIGQVGSHLFSAILEDPHRFRRKSQLYKFCQLAVTSASSGGQPIGHKRLDKRGYSELKAMSQRAWLGR
ncbi:MAG: transposase [Balneolaceae bacterium]|nr:transposase [Balneolaceae bacterium]